MILSVSEIFHSIQGETSYIGMPATFIRLGGCNLKCAWCDTQYSHDEYDSLCVDAIIDKVRFFATELVVVTGGEPLLQKKGLINLVALLLKNGNKVLLETNGSISIEGLDERIRVILDLKCPGSGQEAFNSWANIKHLKKGDEIKFVVAGKLDFDWAMSVIKEHDLCRFHILITPVYKKVDLQEAADWVKNSGIGNIRLNLQMHKYIWGNDKRGV